jgi:hypothetical protein
MIAALELEMLQMLMKHFVVLIILFSFVNLLDVVCLCVQNGSLNEVKVRKNLDREVM